MSTEKGNLSITSENILPIIKKWLYSDTDIFVRELISNGSDAIAKLKKLTTMGETPNISDDEKYKINVILDKENKTIKFIDNGIGMTSDEVKQYINQIAFSGATAFIEKYEEKLGADNEIIGHFGLGFYSAFMVADTVSIDTLSFKDSATPCKWVSDGGVEFEISDSQRTERGTEIILYIGDDGTDFLDEYKLKSTITKYCGFMPVEIYFESIAKIEKNEEIVINDEEEQSDEVKEIEEILPINNPSPLWLKKPNECTDEEYKEFYHKLFNDFNEPLFWMHLNMDYPFRLKGILYFPKLKHELESIEGQVKLYNNQVFIADNIKEVLPEFLLLLKGVIDCPDLPLNVSRSFLQNDGNISKMSTYIIRKVADKLNNLFKKERETYNSYWDDISPFIKYGCIKEEEFYNKVKTSILFKTTDDEYLTIDEFLEKNKEKTGNKIYYVTNLQQQSQYINMFKESGMQAVILTTNLDNPFISYLENYERDRSISFARIDAELTDTLKYSNTEESKLNEDDKNTLKSIFKDSLGKNDLLIEIEDLKSENVPAIILLSEEARRMQEMTKMFGNNGFGGMFGDTQETFVLNGNNKLINLILNNAKDETKKEDIKLMCEHIYDLAMISHKQLDVESMTKFIERSYKISEKLI